MSRLYLVTPQPPLHILSGAAFTTFTAFQDISPKPDIKIPANLLEPGTGIELLAQGHFSNTGTPTLSVGFYWGAVGVPLGQSALITTTTAAAAWPWRLYYRGRVRTVGTAGTIYGQGEFSLGTSLTAITAQSTPVSQALRTSVIDTSIEKVLGVGAQWGTSSASNSITTEFHSVWITS